MAIRAIFSAIQVSKTITATHIVNDNSNIICLYLSHWLINNVHHFHKMCSLCAFSPVTLAILDQFMTILYRNKQQKSLHAMMKRLLKSLSRHLPKVLKE